MKLEHVELGIIMFIQNNGILKKGNSQIVEGALYYLFVQLPLLFILYIVFREKK